MSVHALHCPAVTGSCLCNSPLLSLLNRWLTTAFAQRAHLRQEGARAAGTTFMTTAQDKSGGATRAEAHDLAAPAAQPAAQTGQPTVLFRKVRVFDGIGPSLSAPAYVLVEGNTITRITNREPSPPPGTLVIDGDGRTLMPGMIDAHAHTLFAGIPLMQLLTADIGYVNLVAAGVCADMLQRGFTTVRDMQGPVFGLKQAIDSNLIPGPRIYPSGAMISQTSGHADFRLISELPRNPAAPLSHSEVMGAAAIADGVDAVLRATREQLMRGASQIKIAGGGGVSSSHDPLDVTQYSEAEIRAAVGAAEDWNTYVAMHVYTPRAIQRGINAGVRSIEHGHLADDATARLMADRGIWWSLQPFTAEYPATFAPGSPNEAKHHIVVDGTDRAYQLARRYGVKTAWGTDLLFNRAGLTFQNTSLPIMTRWYTPPEVLKLVTSDNAALLAMSGPRNPYPGQLGVVREQALADLLLVDGDPTEDLGTLGDPERNLLLVMKDGRIARQAANVAAATR
ncbi:MAG: amidohydrolase family protein [Thermomicrobiales bacterium]|nr:amidohydrolase family protein [Thermomicrobiales bacterium]